MKELYDLLTSLDPTSSAKIFSILEKKLYSLCEKGQEGVGYYFLIMKKGLRVFPLIFQNRKYEVQKPFDDYTNTLYQFLKVNRIHSILIRREADVKTLLEYLRGEGPRPPQVLTNVYLRDFELTEKIFEAILSILLYPSQQLNTMVRAISDYQKTQDAKLKEALQKMHGDWIATHNQLTSNIEEVLSRYSRITFIIRYPLGKIRSEDIEPEGFHIFFEDAEFDLEYSELRKSDFFRKAIYVVKGDRKDRLDSLVIKAGMDVEDLFSLIYKIRGKDKLLFSIKPDYQPYLDQKQFPEELQGKFGVRYPIGEDSKIEIVTLGNKWAIRDASKSVRYIIEKTENKLEVYQKIEDIPHIKINPIKVGVLDIEDEFSDLILIHKKNSRLKDLIVKLKKHNTNLQKIVRHLQEKNTDLESKLAQERDRKGGFQEIQILEQRLQQWQQDQEESELAKQMILEELENTTSEEISQEFIHKISQTLKLSTEDVLKLLSPELIEDVVQNRLKNKQHDETLSFLIESGRAIPYIEKGLKENQLSPQEVKEFFLAPGNPVSQKALTKKLAQQMSRPYALPQVSNYTFETYCDFSPQPGGDTCLIYPLDFARYAIAIIDMEGTGLEQSCNLMTVKALLEKEIENLRTQSCEKILFSLHKQISSLRQNDERFSCFAGLLGIFHSLEHSFTYTRASLPYLYIYNRNQSNGHFLKEAGVPRIGLKTQEEHYLKPPYRIELKPYDVLFIATNGLIESMGTYESFASLMDYLPRTKIANFFKEKTEQLRGGKPLEDDVLLFTFERHSGND